MAKIAKVSNREHEYLFNCPGCKNWHRFHSGGVEAPNKPQWEFDGNMDKPTLSPSYLTWHGGTGADGKWNDRHYVCHSFIKNGMIQFLGDCTHELKNKTIELLDIDLGE